MSLRQSTASFRIRQSKKPSQAATSSSWRSCRSRARSGAQVLNVAYGGTLVQDIPSQVPGALPHKFEVPPHQAFELAHEIWLDKDTLLSRLMRERLSDTDACDVNSRHHQAVRQLGPGLIVSATAPDGVIEAIEDPAAGFCLGVQWHPENFWRTGEFRPLFEGLLEATAKKT
jgi:putative glutamine amidotransferase